MPEREKTNEPQRSSIVPPVEKSIQIADELTAVLDESILAKETTLAHAYDAITAMDTPTHLLDSKEPFARRLCEVFLRHSEVWGSDGEAFSIFKTHLFHKIKEENGKNFLGKIKRLLAS